MEIFAAILIGLTGSFHCAGMCGPIALMLPVHNKSFAGKSISVLMYNFGRVLFYATIGLIAGFVGQQFHIAGLQQGLSVSIGIVFVVFAILQLTKTKTFSLTFPYKWSGKLMGTFRGLLQKKNAASMFTLGVLNGMLPCGLVYLALGGALGMAGAFQGALFMVLFGLGTVPMMAFIPMLGSKLKQGLRTKMVKMVPVVVGIMGLLMVARGLNLGIPYISPPLQEISDYTVNPDSADGPKPSCH